MEIINKDNLIPILQDSKLAEQFDDKMTVPKKYVFTNFKIKYEIVINNNEDFVKVMDQLRYYMIKKLPYEIYDYLFINSCHKEIEQFRDFFYDELKVFSTGDHNSNKIMIMSGYNGILNVIKYFFDKIHRQRITIDFNEVLNAAAGSGHLDCIKFIQQEYKRLYDREPPWNNLTTECAAMKGKIECFEYLVDNDCDYDNNSRTEALRNGHKTFVELFDKEYYYD